MSTRAAQRQKAAMQRLLDACTLHAEWLSRWGYNDLGDLLSALHELGVQGVPGPPDWFDLNRFRQRTLREQELRRRRDTHTPGRDA